MERVDYQSLVIQDLINLHKSQELDLTPWYQRRSVWLKPQKAYLINSIFENMPIPSIYIRHYLDIETEKSIKEVVDGQQRIRAVLEYSEDDFSARHSSHKKLVKFSELSKTEQSKFKMIPLSIGYLIEADDSDVIEIFGRLNSVSKTLNAQEKRNAKYSGEVKQFCLKQAADRVNFWRDYGIFSANDISRMLEVQFVSDIVINLINGLSDYGSTKIDKFYSNNDEEFPEIDSVSKRLENVFGKIISIDKTVIKETIFSRHPILFNLILILDSVNNKIANRFLEDKLFEIDRRFNSDLPVSERPKEDSNFYIACTSTTQRIKSRRIRDKYIRKILNLG
jgi:hypothetical protein